MPGVNAFLDRLPRTRVGVCSREGPAFRACGVTGFYLAVAAALAGGLLAGRELPVVAALCLTCALSFFASTWARIRITGREKLVLLEQVWTAEACCALVLAAMRAPVLPYLDVTAPAIALFLGCGRVGCLLAGCCHGRPAELGIVYGEAAADDGFPRHLVGVRLFPVQALEAAGLFAISATGLAALPFAPPGRVFAWFLATYAVLRFGTEGLRGDPRPHWLGLSVPRWMTLPGLASALWIGRGPGDPALRDGVLVAALALAVALAVRRRLDPRPTLLGVAHAAELRALLVDGAARAGGGGPVFRWTSRGTGAAVARAAGGGLHLTLTLPAPTRDLEALCTLAACACPELDPAGASLGGDGALHLRLPGLLPSAGAARVDDERSRPRALELYGSVVRAYQAPRLTPTAAPAGGYFGAAKRAAG
jgi:hypothetical protein